MTSSEKPQDSNSQGQEATSASGTTQTVEESVEQEPTEQQPTEQSPDAGSTDEPERSEEEAAQRKSGEIFPGSDVPPPWQRATTSPDPGDRALGQAETERTAKPSSGAEDTQKIPRPNLDSAATGLGVSGTAADSLTGSAQREKPQERTAVSFAERVASRAGLSGIGTSSSSAKRTNRGPRRASLQVKRVDPWSVLKLALVLSVALFFVWMIAVAVLYGVLDGMGVWDQLNGTFTELTQPDNAASQPLISAGGVFLTAAIVGGINAVLMTALATVGAFIYNVAADLAGGVEVTLSERE